jgi:hypothetical protein
MNLSKTLVELLIGFIVIPLWLFMMVGLVLSFIRHRRVLGAWAASRGFRLVSLRRDLRELPAIWTGRITNFQVLCHFTVADASGKTRSGRAVLGDRLWGMYKPTVGVEWDPGDGLEFGLVLGAKG